MGKDVLVPISLLKQILDLLEYLDISKYDPAIRDQYDGVLRALYVKMQKLELRDAYAKIIAAGNKDDRHDARIEYLWQKSRLIDIAADDCVF